MQIHTNENGTVLTILETQIQWNIHNDTETKGDIAAADKH